MGRSLAVSAAPEAVSAVPEAVSAVPEAVSAVPEAESAEHLVGCALVSAASLGQLEAGI